MERRIKLIHALTIGAIIAYCLVQGYWLYGRYRMSLEEYGDELYATILACGDEEMAVRKALPLPPRVYGYRLGRSYKQSDDAAVESWTYVVSAFDTLHHTLPAGKKSASSVCYIDDKDILADTLLSALPEGLELFRFTSDNRQEVPSSQLVEALNRFILDHQHPFDVAMLDSILRTRGIVAESITPIKADTMVWHPTMQMHPMLWGATMTVNYPYDYFEGQQVVVETCIGFSPVVRRMIYTLLIAIVLSSFLIFCLVYQILTIRRQRRIEVVRQEFMHTMIHELKRPISTLKMCVSFMDNERMMQDVEAKQRLLSSSYNALDNLTAYFSKLRDITLSDVCAVPLSKSRFSLRGLLAECIAKQNVPADKEVKMLIETEEDCSIWADRMHLANIVCNLLENAIKYSRGAVAVRIAYQLLADGALQISVADNGIGIRKADQPHVFEKFYRSEEAKENAIPGIGLGLSYVRLLVEAHGGTIAFVSREGRGTTFTLTIPQTDGKD